MVGKKRAPAYRNKTQLRILRELLKQSHTSNSLSRIIPKTQPGLYKHLVYLHSKNLVRLSSRQPKIGKMYDITEKGVHCLAVSREITSYRDKIKALEEMYSTS